MKRAGPVFLGLVALVIVAAVGIRLAMLGHQSYWIDELFSVNQSDGSFHSVLRIGSTEVHTPFYASVLWAWMKVVGTHGTWTRLLSTLFAVIAVPVTYRGLRAVPIGPHVRWALTVATAAGGTSIVYSLETRNYALLLLGSVGLTVTTLRAALLTLAAEDVPGRVRLSWLGWVALAATTHLFGAILTLGAVAVLAVTTLAGARAGRVRRLLTWAALAAAGCSLQAAWLLSGLTRPGFASGTDWIQAPDQQDLWRLLTTTFTSGDLRTQTDGFAWASPLGVAGAVVLCLGAAGYGYWARSRPTAAGPTLDGATADGATADGATGEGPAAAVLLGLAVIVIGFCFAISQWTHIWTLRNLEIVAPALTWGVICLAAWAAGTATGRRRVATVAVAMLGLSLVPSTAGLTHPYKTDFRGLVEYLIAVRAEKPDADFVFLGTVPPWNWKAASDRPADDPVWDSLYRSVTRYPRANAYPKTPNAGARTPVTQVVIYYRGTTGRQLNKYATRLVARLGPSACRRIPLHGVIVVRCH